MPIPTDFVQTSGGDLDFSLGLRRTSTLAEFVAQKCSECLSLFQGEWFLDTRLGIPYFRHVLGQRFDRPLLEQLFRRALLKVQGVGSVVSLVIEHTSVTRELQVRGVVRTVEGEDVPFEPFIIEDAEL